MNRPRRHPHPLAMVAVILCDALALALMAGLFWAALFLVPGFDAAVIEWRSR